MQETNTEFINLGTNSSYNYLPENIQHVFTGLFLNHEVQL